MARGTLGSTALVLAVAGLALGLGTVGVAGQTGGQAIEVTGCGSIVESGSYRLAANLTAQASPCLAVQASDVDLDGDGHALAASGGAQVGIAVGAGNATPRNVTVHDVTVDGFGTSGVEVVDASAVGLGVAGLGAVASFAARYGSTAGARPADA